MEHELTWGDFLLGYLAVGVLTVVVVYVTYRRSGRAAQEASVREMLRAMAEDEDDLWRFRLKSFVERFVVPALAVPTIIIGWPWAVWLELRHQWWLRQPAPIAECPRFAVLAEHLAERIGFAEIEAANRIADPLGAVPDLPFGHLNGRWRQLVDEMQTGDKIHRFAAPWSEHGRDELRSGYALVRDGEVVGFWILSYMSLPRAQAT